MRARAAAATDLCAHGLVPRLLCMHGLAPNEHVSLQARAHPGGGAKPPRARICTPVRARSHVQARLPRGWVPSFAVLGGFFVAIIMATTTPTAAGARPQGGAPPLARDSGPPPGRGPSPAEPSTRTQTQNDWQLVDNDPSSSGHSYWWNTRTNEVSWTAPPEATPNSPQRTRAEPRASEKPDEPKEKRPQR